MVHRMVHRFARHSDSFTVLAESFTKVAGRLWKLYAVLSAAWGMTSMQAISRKRFASRRRCVVLFIGLLLMRGGRAD